MLKPESKTVRGLQIEYFIAKANQPLPSKEVLFLIHGWNVKGIESWIPVLEHFHQKLPHIDIVGLSLPAFGSSQDPHEVWEVQDFAEFVEQFIDSFGYSKVHLCGHSFGGGVAALVASRKIITLEKLVLIAPAIIRTSQKDPKIQGVKKLTHFLKQIGLEKLLPKSLAKQSKKLYYKLIGSPDYHQTSGIKRQIMQKILTQDLLKDCTQIQIPTLLLWGTKDTYTPFPQSSSVIDSIKNSQLIVLQNINHGIHLHAEGKLVQEIADFIQTN